MRTLIDATLAWADNKGLTNGDPKTQMLKMVSEVGEFADEVLKGDFATRRAELGDILVTCIVTGATMGIDIEEALRDAYNKISVRKGKTVDGVFIKESK